MRWKTVPKLGEYGDYKKATVAGFCLDTTEVTVGAFRKCVDAHGCREPRPFIVKPPPESNTWHSLCNWGNTAKDTHPVNCVDYDQAAAYCAWMGRRIPSSTEWEWAASNGKKANKFPWGDSKPDGSQANFCGVECVANIKAKYAPKYLPKPDYPLDDGFPETAPVGSFPKGDNMWGVHDLMGNVAEWASTKRIDKDHWERRVMGRWAKIFDDTSDKEWSPDWNLGFRCAMAE